ncbi:GtrA family protein [Arenimonas sp.]|uniref:GtrA family protein n=1 Tax=Arenimonas sp. TaxID=1872635 RepID=UPI002E329860|nr:GtrA family protein [Arenimonas sp.]HEX4854991.1 GtrA family protein [Arenimonas sp.]
MSSWRAESGYVGRYLGTGVFNTALGFGVIFLLMWAGVSPVAANGAGYGCGFVAGFALSKRLVFRSRGSAAGEALRYAGVFLLAFLLNLLALRLALDALAWPAPVAQVAAGVVFTASMYVMSRTMVFSPR